MMRMIGFAKILTVIIMAFGQNTVTVATNIKTVVMNTDNIY